MSTQPDVVDAGAAYTVLPSSSPCTSEERATALADLRFGVTFTDHMARATWTPDAQWHAHRVERFAPLQLSPAASVLHYAQEIFEGLKAYRHSDGSVWSFRPEVNARRFAASARRLAMPELPVADFLGSLTALVETDLEWVPASDGASLYLRPFMIATEPFLGVRPSHVYDYVVIASPVGPYFAHGFQPVSIWVAQDYHRAGPGGTGAAKFGGNYAASLLPQQAAHAHGFDQVCFLDAATGANLEELGGMNVFVVGADGRVSTPALTGSILEGVTRSSILQLLAEDGCDVAETQIPLADLLAGIRSGEVREVFACGTAAVVTPIGRLAGEGFDVTVGDGGPGPVTEGLYRRLTDIQFGRAADQHGWMRQLV
ncbi:branched-chain amino acid aminotransferase [Georgenia faecalis]|uniref:Branched-chain-amino-acid aminotransferase n=1 Tax=Georgenia faecalis TaxID=2483799 RepID=A0ABV9DBD3_9MICO|nr:branched-chain amino acid aminotransferase [Georgenia faecalis]